MEVPPYRLVDVEGMWWFSDHMFSLKTPDLILHCPSAICSGDRVFACEEDFRATTKEWLHVFITYRCRNCGESLKKYAVGAIATSIKSGVIAGEAIKLGEYPPFGPHTPSKAIEMIGPDRDEFLKGRRAENQGLGIGAYSYYRRVVEKQRGRLIQTIISAAERLHADPQRIQQLREAAAEIQFAKSLELMKGAIPDALLIKGQNPLALLHRALSEGIHAKNDDECLDLAKSIRVVLVELADRLGQALKNQNELDEAVSRLMAADRATPEPKPQ